jgi:hypothetical protein
MLAARVLIEFAGRYGEAYRLEDFPGFVADSLVYLEPPDRPRLPAAQAAQAAYETQGRLDGPGTEATSQHHAVIRVLLKSALKARREVGLVIRRPGRRRVVHRVIPRAMDEAGLVGFCPVAGRDLAIGFDQIAEVRW